MEENKASTPSGSTYSGLFRQKKVLDVEVMSSIQQGVERTVGAADLEPERDLLIQDFMNLETLTFPSKSPFVFASSSFVEFKFLNYAPIAFKYFRSLFHIKTDSFLHSICSESLRQLENPGASGSIFFLTHDDAFILKTAQEKEGMFLLKLLPGYYLNLTQNPRTLLPKFFGYYGYSSVSRNVRVVVMNNLVPSNVTIDKKYDLKGSTMKRKATQVELKKQCPTFKDLDFMEHYPGGLLLDVETYTSFVETLQRDCRVLESFKIIDYSLLLAVHYVDRSQKEIADANIGMPAMTANGEKLLLFIGIIDILQSYQLRKKLEHTVKSLIYERDSISVHRPDFYSQRFQNFIIQTVFQPVAKKKPYGTAPLHSDPSCSETKILSRSPLSMAWAAGKAMFAKKQANSILGLNAVKTGTLSSEQMAFLENTEETREKEIFAEKDKKSNFDDEGETERQLNEVNVE